MQIIIKNRLNKAEPVVLSNMNTQLPELLLGLAMVPEEKRLKVVSFFSRKIKHIPDTAPTLEDINKILCGAIQTTDWNISHLGDRRLSVLLKGSSSYWNTLEIDETSFFKHRVKNPKLLEELIHQYAKPMQAKITLPIVNTSPLGIRPALETRTLKLSAKVDLKSPHSKNLLLSGIIGFGAGLILFFFNFTAIAIILGVALASTVAFLGASRLQKNKVVSSASGATIAPTPSSPPAAFLPPKKPTLINGPKTDNASIFPDIHFTLHEDLKSPKKNKA